ncbi:MAG: DUF3096 domain-containing protein [bacterium]
MILGIIFVLAGVLIALFPQLLVWIVAISLIFWGLSFIYLSFYYRRISRRFDDPYIDFFFRLK